MFTITSCAISLILDDIVSIIDKRLDAVEIECENDLDELYDFL